MTDIYTAIGKAGTDGTIAPTLQAIADQTRPIVVVVRIAEGETEAELGVRPRILAVPGHDTDDVATALVAIALNGYAITIANSYEATLTANWSCLYQPLIG